jgi:hypothetical protein
MFLFLHLVKFQIYSIIEKFKLEEANFRVAIFLQHQIFIFFIKYFCDNTEWPFLEVFSEFIESGVVKIWKHVSHGKSKLTLDTT